MKVAHSRSVSSRNISAIWRKVSNVINRRTWLRRYCSANPSSSASLRTGVRGSGSAGTSDTEFMVDPLLFIFTLGLGPPAGLVGPLSALLFWWVRTFDAED